MTATITILLALSAAAGLFLGLTDLLAGVLGEYAPDLVAFHRPGALHHGGGCCRGPRPVLCFSGLIYFSLESFISLRTSCRLQAASVGFPV